MLYVYVMLVLCGVCVSVHTPRQHCMVALEQDGISHVHPVPVQGYMIQDADTGCMIKNAEKQRFDNERKTRAHESTGLELVRSRRKQRMLSEECTNT